MSIEFIKLFASKMKSPVNIIQLEAKLRNQNWKDIENMGLMIGQERKNIENPQESKY